MKENKLYTAPGATYNFDLRFQSPTEVSDIYLTETQYSTITITVSALLPTVTTMSITPSQYNFLCGSPSNQDISYPFYSLSVRNWGDEHHDRALIRFDLSQIPLGAIIINASYKIEAWQAISYYGGKVGIHEVLQPWTSAATWNRYDGINLWNTPGGDFTSAPIDSITPSGPGIYKWTVTNYVQSLLNSGKKQLDLIMVPTVISQLDTYTDTAVLEISYYLQ